MSNRNEDARAEYIWYKSHGICVKCRREKAKADRVMCASCMEVNNKLGRVRRKRFSPEKKAEMAAYHKNWYEQRKAEHSCVICGKNPARENRTSCEECAVKKRDREREKRQRMKGATE